MYAGIPDVITLFRPLTVEETAKATRLLQLASAELKQRVSLLDARILDTSLDPEVVASVVLAAVLRVMQNPNGWRQGSETVDDYSRSWTVDEALSAGALYFTAEELALLQPAAVGLGFGTMKLGSYQYAAGLGPVILDARRP